MEKTTQRRFLAAMTVTLTGTMPTLHYFLPGTAMFVFMGAMGFTIGTNLTIWIMAQQIEDMAGDMDVKVSGFLNKTAWMRGGK